MKYIFFHQFLLFIYTILLLCWASFFFPLWAKKNTQSRNTVWSEAFHSPLPRYQTLWRPWFFLFIANLSKWFCVCVLPLSAIFVFFSHIIWVFKYAPAQMRNNTLKNLLLVLWLARKKETFWIPFLCVFRITPGLTVDWSSLYKKKRVARESFFVMECAERTNKNLSTSRTVSNVFLLPLWLRSYQ